MKKRLPGFLLILVLCITFSITRAKADFGDFGGDYDYDYSYDNDYDYDYDDYDYDYGYDNDYDYYDNDYDWDYDYTTGGYSDWGDSNSTSYHYTSSDYSSSSFASGLITFLIIAFILWRIMRKATGRHAAPRRPVSAPVDSTGRQQSRKALEEGLRALHAKDPNFDEEDFLDDASNLYVRLQNAWTAKDLEPIRPALSDSFYAQMDRQLHQNYIAKGHTNVVENISVLGTEIIGCEKDSVNDILTIRINTRITDYVLNDATGSLVRGSKTAEKFMTYLWSFSRPLSKKTDPEKAGVDSRHCPNCGAPIDMNQSAVCAYCGSTLKSADHDWILFKIQGVRQITRDR